MQGNKRIFAESIGTSLETGHNGQRQESVSGDEFITVRHMLPADVPAVAAIEKEAFSDPWSENGFLDAIKNKNTICLTAEYAGNIAGYCILYYAADEGDISDIAVCSRFQRKGVADSLISRTKKEAGNRKLAYIYLDVRPSNLPARKLYEKHGFVYDGRRKNFYQKPQEDALLMVYKPEVSTTENDSLLLQ